MEKVKIKIIKERPSAGFKVGMIVIVPESHATRYIVQGYAEMYIEPKVEPKEEKKEEELLEIETKEDALPKVENKEVKSTKRKRTTSNSKSNSKKEDK